MKKNIVFALSILSIIMLSGCSQPTSTTPNTPEESSEILETEIDDSVKAENEDFIGTVANTLNDTSNIITLSEEDALIIKELWENGTWEDGTADCMDNVILTILSRPVYYHSDCGTFNDKENEKNLSLDSNTKEKINIILEKYIVLDSVERPAELHNKQEISMEDAISLGMEEAEQYYSNLQLTEVHSFDNDENIDELAGNDGKRQWWYVNFANENQNYVSILICDGKIDIVEHFDCNGNNGLVNVEDIQLTAEMAAKKAQEMGIRGGNPNNQIDWASGYHFKMSNSSLVDFPDDIKIFLEVIGISPDGNFAHVDFDACTGEVILAEEKIEYNNGTFEWKEIE